MLELEARGTELEAELEALALDATLLDTALLDATLLELETAVEENLLEAADELETVGTDDAAVLELETAVEEESLLETAEELDTADADEELELAFVDSAELLDELEDLDPCLIAKALSGTLGVAVTDCVEFFKLQ